MTTILASITLLLFIIAAVFAVLTYRNMEDVIKIQAEIIALKDRRIDILEKLNKMSHTK